MQKIMIIGCSGAGKSTLAKKIHNITGLELIHLDQCYWKPGWVESERAEWLATTQKILQKPSWIIDGNYGSSIDMRMEKADTVIMLDYPTWKCLWRVIKRLITYYGQNRPDMPEGCNERFDWAFMMYVYHFRRKKRPANMDRLARLRSDQQAYIFKTDQEATAFLKTLSKQ